MVVEAGPAEKMWGPRESNVSVRGIAGVLVGHPTTNAVQLANHGLLAFGPAPVATVRLVTAIEEAAGGLEAVQQAMRTLKR